MEHLRTGVRRLVPRASRLAYRAVPGVVAATAILWGAVPAPLSAQGTSNSYYEFLMARRLESLGDAKGALAALERAAAADPASAEIRAEMAAFHLRRSEREQAEQAARAALALDADNVEANRVLGLLYAAAVEGGRGASAALAAQLQTAITHLERAAASAPTLDANVQFTLGRLYLRNNEPRKAVEAFSRVLSQNPDSLQGRLSLAQAHAQGGDLKAAISTLEEVVDDDPRFAAALGQYQERAGMLKEAVDSYTRALEARPTDRELKLRRIGALYNAGEYGQAAQLAADARRQHPDDVRFVRLQARALFDAGDRSGAISLLEATARAYPRDRDVQFALVDLYNDAGRSPDAERVLRQILSAEPDNPNALNYLGYLYAVRGENLDEAIRLVTRALEAEPGNGAYLDSLGWAYFRKGDLDRAEKYLLEAAEKLPRNSEILDHVGDLHARRGRWREAIEAWTRALAGEDRDIDRSAVERKIEDARRRMR